MEYIYKIFMLGVSGFWQFIGTAFLITIVVNGIVDLVSNILKYIVQLVRGYENKSLVINAGSLEEKDGKKERK